MAHHDDIKRKPPTEERANRRSVKRPQWNAIPGRQRFVSKPLDERVWEKVDRSGGPGACWPWLGSLRRGYGILKVNKKTVPAHRLAWELANGRSMGAGMQACHTCDNRRCCNPAHIWEGTGSENLKDAVRKNRLLPPLGTKHHCAKLTEDDVRAIRSRAANGERQCDLAKAYGVSSTVIRKTVLRLQWKSVS